MIILTDAEKECVNTSQLILLLKILYKVDKYYTHYNNNFPSNFDIH